MKRESFVVHSSYMQDIPEELYDKFAGMVMRFGLEGKEPEFTDWRDIKIWNSIRERIEQDFIKYMTTADKRKLTYSQNHWKQGRATKEEIDFLKANSFNFSTGEFGTLGTVGTSGTFENPKCAISNSKCASSDTDTPCLSDSEFDSLSEFDCVSEEKTHTPTLEEVSDYVESNSLGIDPERFFDTYSKDGWRIKGKPFDWKKRADYWSRTQTVKVGSASGGDVVPEQWALSAGRKRARKNE